MSISQPEGPAAPGMTETASADTAFFDVQPVPASAPVSDLVRRARSDAQNPQPESTPAPGRRYILFIVAGSLAALFWLAGIIAFSVGQNGLAGLLALPVTSLASLTFVSMGPAFFIVLATVLIAELVRFRGTARQIGAMAARFADPAKATRDDSRAMAEAVGREIARVNGAVEGALARLGAMEEVLGHHSATFAAAEAGARERTDALINDLRREREAVADLAMVLDQKAADIAEAMTEQSKMVVAAADIANAHALDSSKSLEESAARLTGSARAATEGAKQVTGGLDDASERLNASTGTLGEAGEALKAGAQELEQIRQKARDSFAASREDARALADLTRQSVEQMQDITRTGAGTIGEAFESVLGKARSGIQTLREETRAASQGSARQAQDIKAAAEEAKSALEAFADIIAKRLEQANESSFSAARWADKTLERLQSATADLEQKLATLPETADAQARDLQDKLQRGLAGLNAAARSAADEAEEIDAAFQTRIRQNYELLSDFMLRMGAAADTRGGALEVPSPFAGQHGTAPAAPRAPEQARAEPQRHNEKQADSGGTKAKPETSVMRFAKAQIQAQNKASDKNRDDGRKDNPVNATQKTAPKTPAWRWKDVLSGMDRSKEAEKQTPASGPAKPVRSETPAEAILSPVSASDPLDRLVTLFRIHDIDPPALFNTQVYRSLAHARLVGGTRAMTDIVRMEAPGQVRALGAAFADDAALKDAALNFTEELRTKVESAAKQDSRTHLETHLRTGDGPAWLLIEAALTLD